MLNSIIQDVRREYQYGNMVTRLVIVNVAVFLAVNLYKLVLYLTFAGQIPAFYQETLHFFSLSSDWHHYLLHPWVLVTAHFLHEGFWHMLWNMLYLYWFGRIVGDFIGNHRIFPLYILGGLGGSLLFYVSAQVFHYGGSGEHFALGASAACMAMVTASGTIAPNYSMRLLLIGNVKLKYVVLVLLLLDMVSIANNLNTGGHFAHLGGAFIGWFYVWSLRQGRDLSWPFTRLAISVRRLFSRPQKPRSRPAPRLVYKKTEADTSTQWFESEPEEAPYEEQLDAILDKIKARGYASLSQSEKDFLHDASKK